MVSNKIKALKMKNNKFIYLAVLSAVFASCEPEFENSVDANYSAGDADFTTYVSIGNSLTAGYMDGTVYKSGQMNSYPNMLAQQFALVGGGAFTQPSYEDDVNNLGGLMLGGMQIGNTRLVIDASQGRPENITGTPTIEVSDLQTTAYNNAGVPGAKSFHLIAPGYGNVAGVALGQANPYFVRTATTSSATVLGDAMSLNPTFFTNWIGANDVLSYATNGGAIPDDPTTPTVDESLSTTPAADHNTTGNTDPTTYGGNDITNANVFAYAYSTILSTLTANGAKGVVATIPSVTSIPYFTTVPYAPLSPTALGGDANIAQLNAQIYGPLDNIFTAYGEPNRVNLLSTTSANPILIYDADAVDRSAEITGALTPVLGAPTATAFGMVYGKARQATSQDLVVLPASSVIGTTNAAAPSPAININGVTYPMANKWVLTATERTRVANATTAYNNTIVGLAAMHDLAVADMNALMNQLVSGLQIETGQIYTANYFSGVQTEGQVLFSLDGVHPNARGYAVIANAFINVINAKYHANIPLKNPNDYPGIHIVLQN